MTRFTITDMSFPLCSGPQQEVVVYSHTRLATASPIGTSCLAGQKCSIWGSQLRKAADGNSLPAAYTEFVGTSQQGESFISLCPTARVHGIFSNRVLAYSFSEQPTGEATVLGPVDKLKESKMVPMFLSCAFRSKLLRGEY